MSIPMAGSTGPTIPAMGIALSETETGQVLEALQQAFMAADDITSHTDVGQRARDVKQHLSFVEQMLQAGRTSDRLEVFRGTRVVNLDTAPVTYADDWYARRVAANNEKLWTTEAYTREEDAYRGGHRAAPDLAP